MRERYVRQGIVTFCVAAVPMLTQNYALFRFDDEQIASRLGMFFDFGRKGRTTVLPYTGGNPRCEELIVLTGVYGKDETIPNSGGVTDLGLY